ncbi:glycosyltransferase [uncultured Croceitalea sp.]|uniref:glycosyltransferase n=1 Tax=uncultured Croceitalea sp. TaxID=1798908 RepID=UPI003305B663
MQNKKIVQLITGLGGGGAEQMVLKLGKEARQHDKESLIISVSSINTLEQKFKDAGINYHFLGIDSPQNLFSGLRKLKKILKNENIMVIHCHMFHALLIGILFKAFYRDIPLVFTLHNNDVQQKYRAIFLKMTKRFRAADILFSKNGAQNYLKNSIIIPNGLDISTFEVKGNSRLLTASKEFHFLFLGSLTEQKNPLGLIKLCQDLLASKHENFVIDVVGDGPLRSSLEVEINEHNLNRHIKLHGFSNKVIAFLKNSHCLIMPSHWEGMPVVILEAGAAKLPIISTPVGSIGDIISKETGYLSSLDDFSDKMKYVVKEYETAVKKSERFYDHVVTNYGIQEIFDKHLKLYDAVSN